MKHKEFYAILNARDEFLCFDLYQGCYYFCEHSEACVEYKTAEAAQYFLDTDAVNELYTMDLKSCVIKHVQMTIEFLPV